MQENKIKLLVHSDQVTPTGFSRVSHSILQYLPSYYDVAALGINYYGDPHNYLHRIYPASLRGDIYGINRIQEVISIEQPDVIFLINDAWVQSTVLEEIKKVYKDKKLPKIVSYIPVDAKDHDPFWYKNFDIVTHPVAYTDFGKQVILEAAPHLADRLTVIPHGVDSKIFFKINAPKREIKKALYPNKPEFYDDSFIILNAGRNQPRKRIDITMEAFKLFAEGKPNNVKLYLHMGVIDQHLDIQRLAIRLGIENRLIVTNTRHGVQSVSVERLNHIYNATDVGVNTGLGEGWCLPSMEHAVTGVPQVVAAHSALRELYSDCGLLIQPDRELVLDGIMTTGYLVRSEDVASGFEQLYTNKALRSDLADKGQAKFTSPEYSWENINLLWRHVFEN